MSNNASTAKVLPVAATSPATHVTAMPMAAVTPPIALQASILPAASVEDNSGVSFRTFAGTLAQVAREGWQEVKAATKA